MDYALLRRMPSSSRAVPLYGSPTIRTEPRMIRIENRPRTGHLIMELTTTRVVLVNGALPPLRRSPGGRMGDFHCGVIIYVLELEARVADGYLKPTKYIRSS